MLHREARVASEIPHANLVSVLGAATNDDSPCLVLPYCEGVTLWRLNGGGPQLAIAQALFICRQIAEALAALHAGGWLHGQVRPNHVIVSPQGHATLIDLTQARRLESGECEGGGFLLAADENHCPRYSSPECFSSRRRVTAAADVYSLGVILFEALTNRPPFAAVSRQQMIAAHRSAAPPDVRELRCNASRDIAALVRRLLAKEPLRRPSAEQAVRWLAELEIEELRH
jgi:serine/threonine-protein kinase